MTHASARTKASQNEKRAATLVMDEVGRDNDCLQILVAALLSTFEPRQRLLTMHSTFCLVLTAFSSMALISARAADLTEPFLSMFQPLPIEARSADNELTSDKVALGRQLFFDKRFSKNHDLSCNSCHNLAKYGTDNSPTSVGHKGQHGGRSAPSVFNAGVHIAQFWDGRAATVEEQAKGHVLNSIEMAMPDKEVVLDVLRSIPEYVEAFKKSFPGEAAAVTYDNFGKAIGAYERKLMTPARWDDFLKGKKDALTDDEKKGFSEFVSVGCVNCHNGAGVGGHLYQKLGLIKPWPDLKDRGRADITKNEQEKFMFKVPGLRNITETGPYLHDGSVVELPQMVKLMAEHQLGKTITEAQTSLIVTFLRSMTGELPNDYITEPALPPSTISTPMPDPS
jgi:cytochrome c peroxidase